MPAARLCTQAYAALSATSARIGEYIEYIAGQSKSLVDCDWQ